MLPRLLHCPARWCAVLCALLAADRAVRAQAQSPSAGGGGAAQAPTEGEAAEAIPLFGSGAPPWRLSGSFTGRWIGRTSGGQHDNDLRGYTDLAVGDADAHPVTLHASGQGAWDLDRERSPTFVFRSLEDTRNSDVVGYLYTAHIDLHGARPSRARGRGSDRSVLPAGLRRVRIGRQIMTETPTTVFFDGVSVQTDSIAEYGDLYFDVWAGLPNHLFESSPSGDLNTGVAATLQPWTDGRLRVDYLYVTDRYLGSTQENDVIGVRFDQRLSTALIADVRLNLIEFDLRDVSVGGSWVLAEQDLTVRARYTALWNDQTLRAIEFDTFTPLLQTYYAFDQYEVSVAKGFGDHLYVDGGAQLRELRDGSDEGLFNHEFQRYYLTPGVTEWPWAGLDVSFDFEYWDAGGDEFTAFGGTLSQDLDARWRATLGTAFQLYRYDALLQQERENVQVTYARLRFRASDQLDVSARFEFEDGETRDFITGILSARIDF